MRRVSIRGAFDAATRSARWLALIAALFLAALLAFALRDVIERTVILPLAYIWWLLGLYYHAIPEILLWAALVVLILFMLIDSLLPEGRINSHSTPSAKSTRGPIEGLADWMRKAPGGIYYKWLIANRLGKIARELLAQREGGTVSRAFGPLRGRDWNPNDEMAAYLESGLNSSFAEYPRPRWPWSPPVRNPMDLNPERVLEYLESQIGENK